MTQKAKGNIIASIGTVLFMGLVLLLLLLVPLEQAEEQNFIVMDMVYEEEEEEPVTEEVKPTNQPPAPSEEDPGASTPTISEPSSKPTETSAEQIVSEDDLLAIRQQEIADSIAQANEQAKKNAENLIGGFTFTNEDQSGSSIKTDAPGSGRSRAGDGSGGENKASRGGHGKVISIPMPKGDDFTDGDIVVLVVQIDTKGNVISEPQVVYEKTLATTSTIKMAKEAAKNVKFAESNRVSSDTITYIFKFN